MKMALIVVQEFMSFDGVVQAPAYPDEDTSGGFGHGGWHRRYLDESAMRWVVESVSTARAYLFGRRTYETFASHWPKAREEEQDLARPLNTRPKYVASTTLAEPLQWQNSSLLQGEVGGAVDDLKRRQDGEILVLGSTMLVQTLMEHDLVDEFRLMIDPLVLGGGKRIFHEDGVLRTLRLVSHHVTPVGAVLATYSTAEGPVAQGAK